MHNVSVFNKLTFHTMNIFYRVAKEDEGKPIKCILIPVYGSIVEIQQVVNPGCKFSQYKQFLPKVLCGLIKGTFYIRPCKIDSNSE